MQDKRRYYCRGEVDHLFELTKGGDEKAFEMLFSVFFPRLNDFAAKVIKDDVISQDMVQEVFVKLWEKRDAIASINIGALLFRMVRNRCIDYIKQMRVLNNRIIEFDGLSRYEELYRIDFVGNDPYILIEKELQLEIEKTLSELPERCREVFILSRLKGLKNREISEKLQISIKNVERHIHRALNHFRKTYVAEFPIEMIILVLSTLEV